ncbi:MAG: hypothetical protein HC897_13035 [Thermoanaerobaculia bacterium]|nr:hypothetical protein [Thermoanaerobaculia bacterium]
MGRKSRLTPEIQEKIVSVIRAGNYACVAAQYAGITTRTFYRWLEKGEARPNSAYGHFRHAVKAAESEAEVRAVAIIQNLMTNNWQAAMTFLERKFPERWARRIRVTVDPRKELSDLGLDPEEIDAVIDEAAKS